MENTRFLLFTRSTSVEGCCSRIEKEARKIAECTSYTPCVLLSFSPRLSVSVFKENNSYENPISHVVISINFSGYPPPFEYTYTRYVLWPSSVVYSFRYFQTSHMSFVANLHLTVTRPECVKTPYLTFLLLIVLITFLFLFCLFSHWFTWTNFTRILTFLFPMVFLLYR